MAKLKWHWSPDAWWAFIWPSRWFNSIDGQKRFWLCWKITKPL